LVVCGPTATGKSDIAVLLAQKYNGEIISADSRQVYKGMDLGSGKITKREMKKIPHHLLDVADPKKARYTVEKFKRDGEKAITGIVSRGKLPIVCGGTGFYIDALVNGIIFPDVPPNEKLRSTLSKKSVETLMKELVKLDPKRAKHIDMHNKVRIIRAIEIARTLGKVPKIQKVSPYNVIAIGLTLDKENLAEKIHVRLMKRIKQGMVVEILKLKTSGVSWKRLEAFGLEYRYIALYLQKKLSKKEALETLEKEIIQYAKRQMTWFLRDTNIEWFKPTEITKIERFVSKSIRDSVSK